MREGYRSYLLPLALVLSLGVHVFVLLELRRESYDAAHSSRSEVDLAHRDERPPGKAVEVEVLDRQVVDTEIGGAPVAPKDTRFVGRKDQTVEENTRAKRQGKFTASDGGTEASLPPLAELSMKELGIGPEGSAESKAEPTPVFGTPATDDHLAGVKLGQRTLLNTRETKYFAFFERAKVQIRAAWEPELARRTAAPTAKAAASKRKSWTTRVHAILNEHGHVLEVSVTRSSGLALIDEAARTSFLSAGILPNPPRDLVDAHGQVHVPWEFNVSMQRAMVADTDDPRERQRWRSLD